MTGLTNPGGDRRFGKRLLSLSRCGIVSSGKNDLWITGPVSKAANVRLLAGKQTVD
jgi:hypothetical protein